MQTKRIQKIHIFSAGKIFGIIQAILSLLMGIIMSIASILVGSMIKSVAESGTMNASLIPMISFPSFFVSLVIFPILGLIGGFIMGIITALIYNLIAKMIGGFEIDLKDIDKNTLEVPPQQNVQSSQAVPPTQVQTPTLQQTQP